MICLQKDEVLKEIASKRGTSFNPWNLFQQFGGKDLITLMIRCNVICTEETSDG